MLFGMIMEEKGLSPDPELMAVLAETQMPFGKYKGRLLMDLPDAYLVWFHNLGFPSGRIGDLLKNLYEIKLNGLKYLFKPLRDKISIHTV